MFIALSVEIMSMTKSLIKYGKDMLRVVLKESLSKYFARNLMKNLMKPERTFLLYTGDRQAITE